MKKIFNEWRQFLKENEEVFYHGSSKKLEPGDLVLPPTETGKQSEKSRKKNRDRVFFTKDKGSAKIYADRARKELGGKSHIYKIKPIGNIEWVNKNKGTTVLMAPKAKVVEELPLKEEQNLSSYQEFESKALNLIQKLKEREFSFREHFLVFNEKITFLAKQLFQPIGSGTFRSAYKMGDGRVLKIAKDVYGAEDNKKEAELSKSPKFSTIMLEVHELGPEGLWLASEAVSPFSQCSDMVYYFDEFQRNSEALEMLAGGKSGLCTIFQQILEVLAIIWITDSNEKVTSYVNTHVFRYGAPIGKKKTFAEIIQDINNKNISKNLSELVRFVVRNPVNIMEIGPRNTAIDSKGNFVLIDPSVDEEIGGIPKHYIKEVIDIDE